MPFFDFLFKHSLSEIEKKCGYRFKDKNYLNQAFSHRSVSTKPRENYERLEFLGDAILSLIIAELLFLEKEEKEGVLSQKRAKIVSRKHLNLVGRKIIPENKIEYNLQTLPLSVFGNTLESIIGAIYIDKGISQARIFIKEHIYKSDFLQEFTDIDFKTQLLKHSQKERLKIEYKIEKQEGLDHQKEFVVALFVDGEKKAQAKAKSRKEAEQEAAKKVMNNVFCQK